MSKYAVIKSQWTKEEEWPFAGCFLITKETNSFIWVLDENGSVKKLGKMNVVFFTDHKISEQVGDINYLIKNKYDEHLKDVVRLIQEIKEKYQSK